jgi:glycosyltransferase involved in cell wall biosynthesis
MQKEVEKYYAASDAFLFPSYFEAFCLAEIEAAACGLPLLLTPHHGSEMILRDGVNGVRLSFDPKVMGAQVADFLAKGLPDFDPGTARGLTKGEYASQLLGVYERLVPETRD